MRSPDPQQIARFKIHLRRVTGINLNTQRFIDDAAYATAMLDRAESVDDETLVALAVAMRLAAGGGTAAPAEAAIEPRTKADGRKYLFGARGG
ncbi:hypothetical protein G3580_19655 [Nitrogeniibacter mangrovi]|uniref:Uncharacterized protein n=1 Tax=Nitrogeniibacter mangrovi TaxID=2016596 RepID=A0A6C1BAB5_9RHOO|nr:hypothetical protein [Nitrogeniibacter mangrovi]QID19638.1 hypothetical protein G3580_19655 [Nitrogeniibacter mangrovi]